MVRQYKIVFRLHVTIDTYAHQQYLSHRKHERKKLSTTFTRYMKHTIHFLVLHSLQFTVFDSFPFLITVKECRLRTMRETWRRWESCYRLKWNYYRQIDVDIKLHTAESMSFAKPFEYETNAFCSSIFNKSNDTTDMAWIQLTETRPRLREYIIHTVDEFC